MMTERFPYWMASFCGFIFLESASCRQLVVSTPERPESQRGTTSDPGKMQSSKWGQVHRRPSRQLRLL